MNNEQLRLRDIALGRVEAAHAADVRVATELAIGLARERGSVTSVEVWAELARRGHTLDGDPRWMGAVFRRGWRRVGWDITGSHGRPVARWTLAEVSHG